MPPGGRDGDGRGALAPAHDGPRGGVAAFGSAGLFKADIDQS